MSIIVSRDIFFSPLFYHCSFDQTVTKCTYKTDQFFHNAAKKYVNPTAVVQTHSRRRSDSHDSRTKRAICVGFSAPAQNTEKRIVLQTKSQSFAKVNLETDRRLAKYATSDDNHIRRGRDVEPKSIKHIFHGLKTKHSLTLLERQLSRSTTDIIL